MSKTSLELGVGIFVLIGILCVGYLTVRLGKMELLGDEHYFLNARFISVAGLKKGAQVVIAGVPVGQVTQISLDPGYRFGENLGINRR
jgi:phospholipid/cholesterol/gamma-HCH transport system substrate-binding protein